MVKTNVSKGSSGDALLSQMTEHKQDCTVHIDKLMIQRYDTVNVTASMLLKLPQSKYRTVDYYDELLHQGTESTDRLSEYSGDTQLFWQEDNPTSSALCERTKSRT